MFGLTAAGATLAAAALTSAATTYGSIQANDANRDMAFQANSANQENNLENRRFSQQMYEANVNNSWLTMDRNQQFQREMDFNNKSYALNMSNTAYQRAMEDMRRGGLNPILAYQQGGATSSPVQGSASPSGGASQGQTPSNIPMQAARVENIMGGSVASAAQLGNFLTSLRQAEVGIKQTEANTALIRANERNTDVNTALQTTQNLTEEERTRLTRQLALNAVDQAGQIRADTDRSTAQAGESRARTRQQTEETDDYVNWGPPSSPRNSAVTIERAGRRAYQSEGVQRTLNNLSQNPLPSTSGLRDRVLQGDGDRSTFLRRMSDDLLRWLR